MKEDHAEGDNAHALVSSASSSGGETEFQKSFLGGLASMARRMDQLSVQVSAMDKRLEKLVRTEEKENHVFSRKNKSRFFFFFWLIFCFGFRKG